MTNSILSTLKLTTARKARALPDVVRRRNKLIKKLTEQRELAIALSEGKHYAPSRLRTLADRQTGERIVKEVPVRIKPWFWTGEKGETLLSVYYGSKTLELSKGKTAIEIANPKDIANVLDALITAIHNCELDVQMEAASIKLRDGFKK